MDETDLDIVDILNIVIPGENTYQECDTATLVPG